VRLARPWLQPEATPRVAVISRVPDDRFVAEVRRACPGATVHAFDTSAGLRELHLALATHGRFTLVLDDGGRAGAARRFRTVFYHLAPGGALVMRLPRGRQGRSSPIADLLEQVAAAQAAGRASAPEPAFVVDDPRPTQQRDLETLAYAVERLEVRSRYVVAVSRAEVLAKVREVDMDRLLAARAGEDRVVETLPGQVFDSRAVVRSNDPEVGARLHPTFEVPPLSIREYHGVLCRRSQIVVKGNLVLPESFRHPMAARTINRAIADWAPDFVHVPARAAAREQPLAGAYFHLDNELKGHFGHFTSELLSHLWGWERVKALDPTARVVVPANIRRDHLEPWQYAFLEAGGIARDDLVVASGPVRVETLYTSSPMFTMPYFAHPSIEQTWTRIGDNLEAAAPDRDYPQRIFCSRRIEKRGCRNRLEVEQVFVDHGFEVVFPEDYPVPEQIAMFRSAEVVAGFAGSGMFSTAFTGGPRHVIVVGHAGYTPVNEYLMASVLGHRLDLVVSRPDVPRPEKGNTREAYHSDYAFDADREGRFLREVLTEL
jgi:capsular polysaccharide biosynthesis protein